MEFVVSPIQRAILVRADHNDQVDDVIEYMGKLWDINRSFSVYTIFDRIRIDLVTPDNPSKWYQWGGDERIDTFNAFKNAHDFKHYETQEAIDDFNTYFNHIHPDKRATIAVSHTISDTRLDQFW